MKQRTVIAMLDEAATEYSDKPYLCWKTDNGWQSNSFKETREFSKYYGAALVDLGYQSGDKIAIVSEGRPQWVISEFGVLRAHCMSVPLSIKLLPEELLFRVEHSGAKAITVSKNTLSSGLYLCRELSTLRLIYLDEDVTYLEEQCRKENIDISRINTFGNMIEKGKNLLLENNQYLQDRYDEISENDIINICYTSGTSGNPKGAMLSHLNYYSNCEGATQSFTLPKYGKTLCILPLDHSFAHTVNIYVSLIRGVALHFVDARGGSKAILRNIPINLVEVAPDFLLTVPALSGNFMKKIIDGIEKKGGLAATLFTMGIEAGKVLYRDGFSKPSLMTKLTKTIPYKIADMVVFSKVRNKVFGGQLKFCIGGGAFLDINQQVFFRALGMPIYQGYGLTEAAPIICSNTPDRYKMGSSGNILPNVTCEILNDKGELCPTGTKGEIVITGDNVMHGYYENAEATDEALRNGKLHTGDLGYYDRDGFLYVSGRAKALLISADGEKYSPEEIEEVIMSCSSLINQVMLYNNECRFTTGLITLEEGRVKALVEQCNNDYNGVLEQIHKEVNLFKTKKEFKNKFPSVWTPSSFQIIEEHFSEQNKFINSTMKMVRHKITEHYLERIEYMYTDEGQPFQNPQNIAALKKICGF